MYRPVAPMLQQMATTDIILPRKIIDLDPALPNDIQNLQINPSMICTLYICT